MKKIIIITFVLVSFSFTTFAQKHNIVNASISLKNANKVKGGEVCETNHLSEAKQYIDEAYETESTSNSAKMWNYRAPIYLQIALKCPALDKDAVFKAKESYIKCLEKDKKGRLVVRKWTSEEDILSGLVQCGYKLFNVAIDKYNAEDYQGALRYYNAIFDIIPLDADNQLKRGNITNETILYNSFFSSSKMNDNESSKDILKKLIDINFNEPAIYSHISKIYLEEGDNEQALHFLNIGREMFEDDQMLINDEINLYIKLNRTEELIVKLTSAIENDPENEILLEIRGTVYYNSNTFDKSEEDFKKVLEINPNSFNANSILGSIFVNYANTLYDKSNNTNDNKLYDKLRKQAQVLLNKSLPYLEKAFEIDADNKDNMNMLKQIYYKVGDYKKSEEMKKKIAGIE